MTPTPAQIEAADRAYYTERSKGQPPLDCMNAALTAAAEVEPLYKMKGELDPETHRLWRAINGLDIDDFDKRAEAFVHSRLDGLTVGPGNRATVKSALAENFEQLAKDRIAAAEVEERKRFVMGAFATPPAAEVGEDGGLRTFTMYRRNVPDATHNALQKNAPDQPQFEGVIFTDGRCAIRWLTAKGSTAIWDCFDDMMAIHGHPEYGSELVWHTAAAEVGAERCRTNCDMPAAVEVREPMTYEAIDVIRDNAVAATIERCAQVAENYTVVYGCSAIAAAIRALKDK